MVIDRSVSLIRRNERRKDFRCVDGEQLVVKGETSRLEEREERVPSVPHPRYSTLTAHRACFVIAVRDRHAASIVLSMIFRREKERNKLVAKLASRAFTHAGSHSPDTQHVYVHIFATRCSKDSRPIDAISLCALSFFLLDLSSVQTRYAFSPFSEFCTDELLVLTDLVARASRHCVYRALSNG